MSIPVPQSILIGTVFCAMSGCIIVPYKAKPLTETFGGATISRDVLASGSSRTEVVQAFGDSVFASGPHMALVRVRFSDSGLFAAFGGIGPQLGPAGGVAQSDRNWHTQNLFIEFDEQDRVRQYRIVPDSALLQEMVDLLNGGKVEAPVFSPPARLSVLHGFGHGRTATLTLSPSGFSWEDVGLRRLDYPRAALQEIRHAKRCTVRANDPLLANEEICMSFNLQTSGKQHHKHVRISARNAFVLLAYTRQAPQTP